MKQLQLSTDANNINFPSGKIRELSFVRPSDSEPFDKDVAEDNALKNAMASDPIKMPLGTVRIAIDKRLESGVSIRPDCLISPLKTMIRCFVGQRDVQVSKVSTAFGKRLFLYDASPWKR